MNASDKRQQCDFLSPVSKKQKTCPRLGSGFFYLRSLGSPLISSVTGSEYRIICLRSDKVYTFGRKRKFCDFVFEDNRVSQRHCQIFFDCGACKIFIADGLILYPGSVLDQIRRTSGGDCEKVPRSSLNGVFVNGFRIGDVTVLNVGDEVLFCCGNKSDKQFGVAVGFSVENVVYEEGIVVQSVELEKSIFCRIESKHNHCSSKEKSVELWCNEGNMAVVEVNKAFTGISDNKQLPVMNKIGDGCFQNDVLLSEQPSSSDELLSRALLLLKICKKILKNPDPISYLRNCRQVELIDTEQNQWNEAKVNDIVQNQPGNSAIRTIHTGSSRKSLGLCELEMRAIENQHDSFVSGDGNRIVPGLLSKEFQENRVNGYLKHRSITISQGEAFSSTVDYSRDVYLLKENSPEGVIKHTETSHSKTVNLKKDTDMGYISSGRTFFFNRLEALDLNSLDQCVTVSLPQLVSPVESLTRIFVATFTSDILWFLSCCEVPNHLPVTIACHNSERCWSSNPDKRSSTPYSEYPNLMVVYPPFPDVLAFGKDRKKKGIACHHPKLIVLQREDNIRVIITSANLVSKQWNGVTNTVWWQDFPCKITADYSSIFHHSFGETIEEVPSDFAAQLAGFMACLVVDVPSQAYWTSELAKYDFRAAVVHLVASIPGMHIRSPVFPSKNMHLLSAIPQAMHSKSVGVKFVGSVQTSVVGLSHRFYASADSNGVHLKALAAFLGKCQCQQNANGMAEVVLKRNPNIPADGNAVSVIVCDLEKCTEGDIFHEDYVQLGFLPKNVAKWVAPLCDDGFFNFSAYIFPEEALAALLRGSNNKVQLILYVSQGPNFSKIPNLIRHEHIVAICHLLASIERCLGLWRLQEVLSRYKWPDSLETDFVYGSSSIGSLDSCFLAAFSAAAGKRSLRFSDSEESDPEWGCWNASHESRNPSIRILFPTIDRVKNGTSGIWSFKYLLSLSEKTWQRLRPADIFHDAIPQLGDRVGYPMHAKVARRRFQDNPDSSSFGWIYCGSHNFSPAAWGRPLRNSPDTRKDGTANSVLGSRLRICNYELGIILLVPPSDVSKDTTGKKLNLDDITLPFVVPAPKYRFNDRPATARAMREAMDEVSGREKESVTVAAEEDLMDEEIADDEEEMVEAVEYVAVEKEEEKAYAETLWSQVDSSDN